MGRIESRIGVGVRGAGTVGSGVIRELQRYGEEYGVELRKVAAKDPNKPERDYPAVFDENRLLTDPEIKIIIETPGGVKPEDQKEFILRAFEKGKSVVTPSKAVIALYAPELFQAAREFRVGLLYEATVAAGIPLLGPIFDREKADRLKEIKGIVNGTTNYMLSEMDEAVAKGRKRGSSSNAVKNQAIARGYAETNPESDLSGEDAAYKLAILFMQGFNSWVDPRTISTRGITEITPIDLDFVREYGTDEEGNSFAIKLLAIAKRVEDDSAELRVTPAMISDPQLASVNGAFNAVRIVWELAGSQMFTGLGAGTNPTTSAVMDDLRMAVGNLERGPNDLPTLNQKFRIKDPQEIVRAGYLRFDLRHIPGSAGIAYTICGENGLNLEDISQRKKFRRTVRGEVYKPDIVTFEPTTQRNVDATIKALKKSDRVVGTPVFIPFE